MKISMKFLFLFLLLIPSLAFAGMIITRNPAEFTIGDEVVITGNGFGSGSYTEELYDTICIGDLNSCLQPSDIDMWTDTEIIFTLNTTALPLNGPIIVHPRDKEEIIGPEVTLLPIIDPSNFCIDDICSINTGYIDATLEIHGYYFGPREGKIVLHNDETEKDFSANVISWSDERIVCTIPEIEDKSDSIKIIREDDKSTDSVLFYINPPYITPPIDNSDINDDINIDTNEVLPSVDLSNAYIEIDSLYLEGVNFNEDMSLEITNIDTNDTQTKAVTFVSSSVAKVVFDDISGLINKNVILVLTRTDGSYKILSNVTLTSSSSVPEESQIFTDVTDTSKYYSAIKYLKDNEIVNGYPDGTFKSENSVNRAEACKFFLNGADIVFEEGKDGENLFSDTVGNDWYSDCLRVAVANNIIAGYPDGTYKPTNTVNGVEALKIYLEAKKFLIPEAEGDWWQKYLTFAINNNIVDSTFDPNQSVSRGLLADIIYRADQVK